MQDYNDSHSTAHIAGALPLMAYREQDPMGLIQHVRRGLPWKMFTDFLASLDVPQKMLADSLSIPSRTFIRRKKEGVFSPDESDKLLRLLKVYSKSIDVFEGEEQAKEWLFKPNRALQGKTPMSLLDTGIGTELVLDTLGRIEHGIFA